MTRTALVLVSILMISACASTATKRPTAVAQQDRAHPDKTLICEMERPTGSNMLVRVCREPEAVEAEREATLKYMAEQRAGPNHFE